MTFEDILGGGYVVASDDWLNMTVVWNGSATFNVYAHVSENAYRAVDCFTREVVHAYSAKVAARKWLANQYDEMERYFKAA
jgi:hypothetical protein